MLREKKARELKEGDVIALPFGKRATVKAVKIGNTFVSVTWVEPYMMSRFGLDDPVMLEGVEETEKEGN